MNWENTGVNGVEPEKKTALTLFELKFSVVNGVGSEKLNGVNGVELDK